MSATTQTEVSTSAPIPQGPAKSANGKSHGPEKRPYKKNRAAPVAAPPAPVPATVAALPIPSSKPVMAKAAPGPKTHHVLMQGLIEALPADSASLTLAQAETWMQAAAAVLKLACNFQGSLTITATQAG